MSDSEQDEAILRIVREKSEIKKRRVLLESELTAAGHSLYGIGAYLKEVSSGINSYHAPEAALQSVKLAPSICGLENIRAILEELRDVKIRIAELEKAARDYGID